MNKITGLVIAKRRDKRVNVFLDGRYAFSLEKSVVLEAGLRTGQELDDSSAASLAEADERRRCMNAATRFLSHRARSEKEVVERLKKHGFAAPVIEKTVARLRESGFIDDDEFARLWTENRKHSSPRSRRMLKVELQQKGVSPDIIEQAVLQVDETGSACKAALKKARTLSRDNFEEFRRRLAPFLLRRGFSYETIEKTIKLIWKENKEDN